LLSLFSPHAFFASSSIFQASTYSVLGPTALYLVLVPARFCDHLSFSAGPPPLPTSVNTVVTAQHSQQALRSLKWSHGPGFFPFLEGPVSFPPLTSFFWVGPPMRAQFHPIPCVFFLPGSRPSNLPTSSPDANPASRSKFAPRATNSASLTPHQLPSLFLRRSSTAAPSPGQVVLFKPGCQSWSPRNRDLFPVFVTSHLVCSPFFSLAVQVSGPGQSLPPLCFIVFLLWTCFPSPSLSIFLPGAILTSRFPRFDGEYLQSRRFSPRSHILYFGGCFLRRLSLPDLPF